MNYSKSVIVALALFSVFSGSCLVATYQINENTKALQAKVIVNNDLREGLKQRLEKMQQQSSFVLPSANSLVFNEMFPFPARDYFDNFQKELDRVFEENRKEMYELNSKAIRSSSFMVENTDENFKVSAILQNVTKEMLKVSVHKGFLTVTAEEKVEAKEETKEKRYSSFKKVIKLPRNVDETKAATSFKEGVLVVSFPKTELKEETPLVLEIK